MSFPEDSANVLNEQFPERLLCFLSVKFLDHNSYLKNVTTKKCCNVLASCHGRRYTKCFQENKGVTMLLEHFTFLTDHSKKGQV